MPLMSLMLVSEDSKKYHRHKEAESLLKKNI